MVLIIIISISGCDNSTSVSEITIISDDDNVIEEKDDEINEQIVESSEVQDDLVEEDVEVDTQGEIEFAAVLPDVLNVRESHTTESAILSTIERKYSFERYTFQILDSALDDEEQLWYKIEYEEDKYGWIAGWYTEVVFEDLEYRKIAEEFAGIVNSRNYDDFRAFLDTHWRYKHYYDYVFEHYDMLYDGGTIEDILFSRDGKYDKTYSLVYDNGLIQEVSIEEDSEEWTIFEHTIAYSIYIEEIMNVYIDAIKDENWEDVTSILSPPEYTGDYPEYQEEWLVGYKNSYDLDSIEWKLEREIDLWEYEAVIYGYKDGEYQEHIVTIWTADSLLGIIDSYLQPEFVYWEDSY